MKITFELTPIELTASIKDGSILTFLQHATTSEKIAERAAVAPAPITPTVAQTATTLPGPGIQMPGSNLPPVIVAPAPAPAIPAFDPMAMAPIPATPIIPAPAAPAPAAPAAGQPNIDEVRAQIAPLIKAGKVAEMQTLFSELGAAKLTDVKPELYSTLIAKAAAL